MAKRARRAELTIEYALVIAMVVAALGAMQVYMKRGIQGVIKTSTDQVLGLPAQEFLNAKTAAEFTAHKRPVMGIDSQWLGAWERGLIKEWAGGQTTSSSSSSSTQEIQVQEYPVASGNPIMKKTIKTDQTIENSASHKRTLPAEVY